MKTFITSLVIVSLLFGELTSLASQPAYAEPQPRACLFCILVVIGIVVAGVMIIGLIKMCKNIPASPPPNTETNNVPPNPANPAFSTGLPPLTLPAAPGPVTLQSSSDGANWVNETTFNIATDGTNVTVTSSLGTNTARVYLDMSQGYFAATTFTNAKPREAQRFYRLVSAIAQ